MNKDKTQRIAVLGAGSWGTALSLLLALNNHTVHLYARDSKQIQSILATRQNQKYLDGFALPDKIVPTASLEQALNEVETVFLATPSGALRQVAKQASAFLTNQTQLVSAAKGLEEATGLRMSQVLEETLPNLASRLVVLSGPNLAVEVARGAPTASVAASKNSRACESVQQLFNLQTNPTFRVYSTKDVVGVELGGAIKNVIAIGAGVCEGLGYGDNSKAALMTRGLTEAIRLGTAHGAESQTFLGLSGVGDLIATGGSKLSRNYRVGMALGKGERLQDILVSLGQVAEGVPTTHVICDLAKQSNVEMPLCSAIYSLLYEAKKPADVIRRLMQRPLKAESLPAG